MGENNSSWTGLCITVRTASFLAVLYNIAVFAANFILYVKDRSSWQDNSNTEWVRWQWIDLSISGVSIVAALMLYIAIITKNHRLIQVFLIWTVVCIVLSIMVLGFGFGELERAQIVVRCIGIVISAYFADVLFSYFLKLKRSEPEETRENARHSQPASLHANASHAKDSDGSKKFTKTKSYSLEPSQLDYPSSDMCNGGFHDDNEISMIEQQNIRNVSLWYEDTKF